MRLKRRLTLQRYNSNIWIESLGVFLSLIGYNPETPSWKIRIYWSNTNRIDQASRCIALHMFMMILQYQMLATTNEEKTRFYYGANSGSRTTEGWDFSKNFKHSTVRNKDVPMHRHYAPTSSENYCTSQCAMYEREWPAIRESLSEPSWSNYSHNSFQGPQAWK
jgi:hypothetical protein